MKIITSVLLLVLLCYASSQVIGIDFGTQFWKASLISPGKNLVIVENSRSGRKSYNGISFMDGIRHFEYDAFQKRQKKPQISYFYLNKLLESLDSQTPVEGYRFENGTYYFTEGEDTFSLEQFVGMILKNIKKYSSGQAGSDIKDAVLTVPAHWGFKSRIALVNAASLADLSVLGLINENSAAAVHFAITRNDTDPVNIGFFNLGSNVLQITFVQFYGTLDPVREKNIESMRVLSHVSVPNLGGLEVDKYLADHIVDIFQAKHNVQVHDSPKAWVKLLHKCSDLKETLSANKEANIYIEGFLNGIDLNMVVKREVLEKSKIFGVLKQKLQEALDKSGLTKEDVHSVEVIGGASRIPLIGKILKDFFDPVEVGSHINGDESMAFGAALRAANLSIAFRVKQLHFYDGHPEEVRAVITNIEDGVLSETVLFNKDSEQGLKREVVVSENDADVKVSIYYGEQLVHEYLVTNVSQWRDKFNQTTHNISESPKLILIFSAHSVHFAQLKEAYVNITLNTSTTKQVYELVVENVTIQVDDKKDENQTVESENSENKTEGENVQVTTQGETEQNKGDEKTVGQQKSENETKQQKQSKKRTRQRTRNVKKLVDDFKIENKKTFAKFSHQFAKYRKFSKEEIDGMKEIIHKYQKHEDYIKERAKIRNDFESTLYRLKDDFDNPSLKTFSTEDELESLKVSVGEQLVWFDQNAWTAEKVDFEYHFKIIQKILNPIVNRSQEYNQREETFNKTMQLMSLVYTKTVELIAAQPWVQEKAEAHLKKINQTVEQIHTKVKKQVERKLNEKVIYFNQEMIDKAEDLRDQYYLIKMIPRPKVVKKVVENPKEEPTTTDENIDLDKQEAKQEEQKGQQPNNSGQTSNENQERSDEKVEQANQQSETKQDL